MLSKHKRIKRIVSKFSKQKALFSKRSLQNRIQKENNSAPVIEGQKGSNPAPTIKGTYYIVIAYSTSDKFQPHHFLQFKSYSDPDTFAKFLKFDSISTPDKYSTGSQYEFSLNGTADNDGFWTTRIQSPSIEGVLGVDQSAQTGMYKIDIYPLTQQNIKTVFTFAQDLNEGYGGKHGYYGEVQNEPIQFDTVNQTLFLGKWGQAVDFYIYAKETPPIPDPKPVPGPLPPIPQPGDPINPVNYGKYSIKNSWCQRYLNYSVSDHKVILDPNPILFETKIDTDGKFYIHCPQYTSYLKVIDSEIKLSPQPQTLFSLQNPSVKTAPQKYCLHVQGTDQNLVALDYSNLGLDPYLTYKNVFQYYISLPQPTPVPITPNFNVQPIENQYFKPFQPNQEGQYDFFNCGPSVDIHPGTKATIPLGYKQGDKAKPQLKMLLKPRQYHFSKSILGRLVHISKKGKQYAMDLLNVGKKKETISEGQKCASGLIQDGVQDIALAV